MRLFPPLTHISADHKPFLEELEELGDSKRNSASINTLLSSQSTKRLANFIDRMIELRDNQRTTLQQFMNCVAYDRFIEKQMTVSINYGTNHQDPNFKLFRKKFWMLSSK